jgi:hypothetical protein
VCPLSYKGKEVDSFLEKIAKRGSKWKSLISCSTACRMHDGVSHLQEQGPPPGGPPGTGRHFPDPGNCPAFKRRVYLKLNLQEVCLLTSAVVEGASCH